MLIRCGIRSRQPAHGASLLPMADSWRFSVKNSMGISGRWRTFDNEPRCGLPIGTPVVLNQLVSRSTSTLTPSFDTPRVDFILSRFIEVFWVSKEFVSEF